jgi:DNA integrity scanning protein DisA with diadenylate cyclase activity
MTIAVLKKLCSAIPWCEPEILEQTVELALEIAREGREGRRIGTLFTLGAAEAVLAASRPLILDPGPGTHPGGRTSAIQTSAARSRSWRSSMVRL